MKQPRRAPIDATQYNIVEVSCVYRSVIAVAMADQLGVSPLESSYSSLEWTGGPRSGVDAVMGL